MPTESPQIEVLLATFNGERFLREQIESILTQTYPNVRILARDDGSSDGTLFILREYADRLPCKFTLLPDATPTGGAQMNFRRLLLASTAPYVAFADQDDVWVPEKLHVSVTAMHALEARTAPGKPLLIFTDLRVVDEQLRVVADSFWKLEHLKPSTVHCLHLLIARNVVTGCTALLNRTLAKLVGTMPDDALFHDAWAALLACTLGHVDFLRDRTVLYRQHSANVVGAQSQPKVFDPPRLKDHSGRERLWRSMQHQAAALLRKDGNVMEPANRRTIEEFVRCDVESNRLNRVRCMLSNRFFFGYPRLTLAMLWYLWDRDSTPSTF